MQQGARLRVQHYRDMAAHFRSLVRSSPWRTFAGSYGASPHSMTNWPRVWSQLGPLSG
jgi:hypothetical protein